MDYQSHTDGTKAKLRLGYEAFSVKISKAVYC